MPARSSADDDADRLGLPLAIELAEGEEWTVRLSGLGSAGYDWVVEVHDTGPVECMVTAIEPAAPPPPPGGPPPDSSSLDLLLTVRGVARGETVVALRQRRPWAADEPPHRSHDLEVTVR